MWEKRHVTFTINYEQLIKLYRKYLVYLEKKWEWSWLRVESGERKMNGGIVSHIVE